MNLARYTFTFDGRGGRRRTYSGELGKPCPHGQLSFHSYNLNGKKNGSPFHDTDIYHTYCIPQALSAILLDLADRPEYIEPLREEAESAFSKDGFTKASLAKLHKLESFMMESQRVKTSRASMSCSNFRGGKENSHHLLVVTVTSNRWCIKDYVFSNGIRIPKNTMVAVTMRARHYDSSVFPDPYKFDGFRFCKTDDERGNDDKNDNNNTSRSLFLTSANSPFMLFGMGEHAW